MGTRASPALGARASDKVTWCSWWMYWCEGLTLLSVATNVITYALTYPLSSITNTPDGKLKPPQRVEESVTAAFTTLWLALVATPIGRVSGLLMVVMAAGVIGLGDHFPVPFTLCSPGHFILFMNIILPIYCTVSLCHC